MNSSSLGVVGLFGDDAGGLQSAAELDAGPPDIGDLDALILSVDRRLTKGSGLGPLPAFWGGLKQERSFIATSFAGLLFALCWYPAAYASGTLDGADQRSASAYRDDAHGPLTAFAADICKAVTAATLGDAGKARFLSLPDEQHGLKALQAGKAELMPAATPDMRMSAIYGVAFGPPVFFDGQGFLISRDQGVAALTGLAGKPICLLHRKHRGRHDAGGNRSDAEH